MQIFINSKLYQFGSKNASPKKNYNILQICEFFNIYIPKFCYDSNLNVAGNCRMCLVEVEKAPKPIIACATPFIPNMKIKTNSALVKKVRENILELLLVNHPLDCPICDQGGDCDLQDNVSEFGSDRSRHYQKIRRLAHIEFDNVRYRNVGFLKTTGFGGPLGSLRRPVENKLEVGTILRTVMVRCIHCTRCVRFIEKYGELDTLKTLGRGTTTEIGSYVDKYLRFEYAGTLADLCPVGALLPRPYRFTGRLWELQKTNLVDFHDTLGLGITVFVRQAQTNIWPKLEETAEPGYFWEYTEYGVMVRDRYMHNYEAFNQYPMTQPGIVRVLPAVNTDEPVYITDKARFAFDGLTRTRLQECSLIYEKRIFRYATPDLDRISVRREGHYHWNRATYVMSKIKVDKTPNIRSFSWAQFYKDHSDLSSHYNKTTQPNPQYLISKKRETINT